MGPVSRALNAALFVSLFVSLGAYSQTPENILGTEGGAYVLYPPDVAVRAGLPPLSANDCLKANAAGTALAWGACGSGGSATPLSDATPEALGTASAGSSSDASRGDHVHPTAGVATEDELDAGLRIGISEFRGSTDQDFLDTMRLAQTNKSIETGDKFFQVNAGLTYNGQVLRYNGTTIPANPQAADLLRYFDVILKGGDPFPGFGTAKPVVASGTGAAGAAGTASRSDHAHPVGGGSVFPGFDTSTPLVASGTGAVGASAKAAHGDHVHPIPPGIAMNADTITTVQAVANQNSNSIHTLNARRNPALASGTAGYLVRQKSDHSAYEAIAPSAAVLAGLPGVNGHGGNCLKVNTAEAGVEWATCGGGSSGGGSSDIYLTGTRSQANYSSNSRLDVITGVSHTANAKWYVQAWTRVAFNTTQTVEPELLTRCDNSPYSSLRLETYYSEGSGYNVDTVWQVGEISLTACDDRDFAMRFSYGGRTGNTAAQFNLTLWNKQATGGGGSSGPSIPAPSSGGAGQFLRVNAAGAAYELAAIDRYELPGPQGSPVLAETPIPYNAGAVGHSLETGFDLDDVPNGAVYIRVTDPDHNTGVYSIWTTRAHLLSLPAISAGSSNSQVLANHVILRDQSGQAKGYFAGRISGSNDLWLSAPATHASGGTLMATAVAEAGWAEYAVARNKPPAFPGYGNVLAIKSGASIQGSATTVARSDHQHAVPGSLYGNPVDIGTANAGGSATTLARSDHVHKGATAAALATTDAQVGLNTQNIEANTAKIGTLEGRGSTALWSHTATATQWAAGEGRTMAAGVNAKIWAGFDGGAATGWQRLEAEVKFRVTGSPNVSHYGTIIFGTHRAGDQSADDASRIWGSGFINGTLLHAVIHLPQETAFNSTPGTMHIDNCSFCTNGTESLAVTLYGVR